ncbi:MetQ/NlpA family ABC transporter substrate-binding protein [Campylobacter vulpis]|uniref:MetQ/NlpA family ABC transporter substrate-binding protein n=4 Tax=Campylobacter vulpis TaxID=1655500 RepID=A0A2G4R6K7_9BACT|nr:MetQ/NlpA family ABC transporter substrate-binding protein [Campylobacter vulpis]MBS4240433.1 MetQ/NlpA family ABC transporter substrate-binding protein [Campylobacter vulpis]MBS4251767.1 MetQ/NlpA family ABC transporter substrate-binding protein [Campylobacter vulpis]MBS4281456.1 MetQ/NlpA family ABC transporter substrate-binding protein [Campylobacter vulpis]MBS4330886.1 MetQ/NlpA family ABC transporter substrate-binding protein [Campylobacter vulpis]MBS4406216.1 MetQ/NlpA family ABC tran
MKKLILIISLLFHFTFANDKTIVIGATPTPHAEILEFSKDLFKEKGWNLEVKEFADYILPNKALSNKELDANLYQHKPFLDEFNAKQKSKLVAVDNIILVPMAGYSKKIKDKGLIPQNAKIAIPNDPTNESRALDLLQKTGLIKLNNNILKTPLDIVENPKKLKFLELKAAQLPRALDDVDVALIPTNYALGAKLNPKDGLFIEDEGSLYAIVLAVQEKDKGSEKTQIIKEVLKSEAVKKFIKEKYNGAVISLF